MRARREKQQELFSFVEIEKLVPKNHLLRLIDRYVDFSFIHELVDSVYSNVTGRPAWNPELILRYILIGYLYNMSERRLHDEVAMHAAYRWFLGLTFSDLIPDRTTVIKLRKEKWADVEAFDSIFQRIVQQCVNLGMVKGRHLTVDGTQIIANASIKSLEPIEIPYTPKEYLDTFRDSGDASPETEKPKGPPESHQSAPPAQQTQVEPTPQNVVPLTSIEQRTPAHPIKREAAHSQDKDFHGEHLSNQTHRSRTDSDARLYRKAKGKEAKLSNIGGYLADSKSRVILATSAGIPGIHSESDMAVQMLDSLKNNGILPATVILAADAHYGNTDFLCELDTRSITPHIPLLFGASPEKAPVWKKRTFCIKQQLQRTVKTREIRVRNHAREAVQTTGYKVSQKLRKRSEHLFAEAKGCHGLGRARGRGLTSLKQQINLTASAQNIKRIVSFCSRSDRIKVASCLSCAKYTLIHAFFRFFQLFYFSPLLAE